MPLELAGSGGPMGLRNHSLALWSVLRRAPPQFSVRRPTLTGETRTFASTGEGLALTLLCGCKHQHSDELARDDNTKPGSWNI